MTSPKISRRDLLFLAGAVGVGAAASYALRRGRALGVDVGGNAIAQAVLHDSDSPRLRAANADLSAVLFTDYLCPVCKASAPALQRAVAADGRVTLIFRDWPIFGPRSDAAARTALAAVPQGIYPALHARLMAEQRKLDPPILREAVEAVGGNWARLQADLAAGGAIIATRLARNASDARGHGLAGTPSMLIGPLLTQGALDESQLKRAFSEARQLQL